MSLADYQPYLEKAPNITMRTQSYHIDLGPDGWRVTIGGRYVVKVDTRQEAQRWLAGFLLAASTVETPSAVCNEEVPDDH